MFDRGYSSAFETSSYDTSISVPKTVRADLYSEGDISGSSTVIPYTILATIYTSVTNCISEFQTTTNTLMKTCHGFKERGKSKILLIRLRRED